MDPCWSLAATVELRRDLVAGAEPDGYVEAGPHATGWFILGHCRATVTERQLADFREFTTVRTFLLLSRGPVPGVWRRVPGSWVADWVDPVEELDSLSELEPERFSGASSENGRVATTTRSRRSLDRENGSWGRMADVSAANRTAAPVAPVPRHTPRPSLTTSRHFPGLRSTSLRTRIAGWTILLLTGVTVTTIVAAHVLLMQRTSTEITAELLHEVDEFNSISPPPSARSPVIQHMRMATARVVPSSDVVKFGLADGRLVAVSGNVHPTERRADLPVLRSLVRLPLPASGNTTLDQGPARFVVVPVHVAGDPVRGAFVIATLTEPAYAQVWSDTRLQIEVGLVCLLVAYGLAWIAAGRTLRPVRETTELARRINATALGGRLPVRGDDEFDHMADSFNDMLDRLEDTLETQRRFLADAGHELRTPITIVQGNLDTLSVSDPDDTETLALVSTELDRMTRMVNDLLVLASSHQADFVRLRTADLGALGVSLAAKVEALGDRSWRNRSTWSGSGLLDVDRVTQAVVELCSNALSYTQPGTDLSLRLSEEGPMLVVCVVDHGPGVPVEFAERVFDRFVRGEGASGISPGSGLGLSIVAAIASGHGGDVAVSQTPGGGATFILRLPREPAPSASATDRTA